MPSRRDASRPWARQFVKIAVVHKSRVRDRSDRRHGKFVRSGDLTVARTLEVKEAVRTGALPGQTRPVVRDPGKDGQWRYRASGWCRERSS
jgi:hypothetical protein